MTRPRGRPPTGTALSGAERARRYRQRERERQHAIIQEILQLTKGEPK
jgi:hypothetical protein